MSIAQRLLLLLSTTIAALLLLAGINYTQTGRVFTAANFGTENVVPSVLVLDDALMAFADVRVRVYRHILADDEKRMQEIEKTITEGMERTAASLQKYDPLVVNDEDRSLLNEEKRLLASFGEGVKKTQALSLQGHKDAALKALEENRKDAKLFLETLQKHMHFNEKLAQDSAAEAVATRNTANLISIGTALLALLIVGGLSVQIRTSITSRLQEANQMAGRIASGDLASHSHATNSNDEVGQLMQAMEKMRGDLAHTVSQIASSTHTLANSASQISTAVQQVSVSTQTQSSATAAAAAAVEELTVSIDHVSSGASDANARAQEAGQAALSSGQNVSEAASQIHRVSQSVDDTAQRIGQLAEQVQLIGNITTVIREVADQTNLLALNAAIEAARAGEQGRGFAVVADEVRKLAERTTLSVQEISTLIGSIQSGVSGAEESMAASRRIVGEVVDVAQTASGSMNAIESATGNACEAISGISYALREQQTTSTELARNVEAIAQMADENNAAVGSVAHTAHELVAVSEQLKTAVSRFRT